MTYKINAQNIKQMKYVDQFTYAVFNLIDEKYGRVIKYYDQGPTNDTQWCSVNFETSTGLICNVSFTYYVNTTHLINLDFSYLIDGEEYKRSVVHKGVHNPLWCASWIIEKIEGVDDV